MPDQEAIAKRAYELYLERGSTPGYETEDWLQAEAELAAAEEAGDEPSTRRSDEERPATGSPRRSGRRENQPATGATRRAARP